MPNCGVRIVLKTASLDNHLFRCVASSLPESMVLLHRTASYSTRSNSFKHFTSPNNATRAFFKQRGYYPDGDSCLLHRIPWGHLDSLGHLNNAQYLSVIESSRIHYFDVLAQRHPGFPPFFLAPKGICPVFRQANVEWRRQLVRNDIVAVQHKLTKIGSTSLSMEAIMVLEQSAQEAFSRELPEQKALEEQDIALSCEETLVLYDFDNHSKAAIPTEWREIFEAQMQLEQSQQAKN